MQIERFFDELSPRLETARGLERELDQNLARKFNVLDYLRTDELGLSRIIADLVNPKASHGQGVMFLRTLLRIWSALGRLYAGPTSIEHQFSARRRSPASEGSTWW